MNRNVLRFFLLSLITILSFSSCKDEIPNSTSSPNILLVIADDFGLDACPCYSVSNQKPAMPVLESLCSNGIVFENFYTNPECSPTRSTLLTGRYGVRTGVLSAETNNQIPLSETSIQKFLDEEVPGKYNNAVIGKWHLSGSSNGGANNPGLMGVSYYSGFLQGAMPDYWNWNLTTNGNTEAVTNQYATTVFTDLAIDWIKNQDKPWFLWLAYTAPHKPFHLPPDSLISQHNLQDDTVSINANPRPYYFAMLEALDHEMGRLLNSLSASELENTLIIFIGDNGTPAEVVQAPFSRMKAKGTLYEGGIHVPMIVSGAGVPRKGERETALINSTDIFATVADVCGTGINQWNDSYSFKPLFYDASSAIRNDVYSDVSSDHQSGWTIRDEQYKLIHLDNGEEFYDLSNDPYEQTNLLSGTLDSSQAIAKLKLEIRE